MFSCIVITYIIAEDETVNQLLAQYPVDFEFSTDRYKMKDKRKSEINNGLAIYSRLYRNQSVLAYLFIHHPENIIPDIKSNAVYSHFYLISPTMEPSVVEEVKNKVKEAKGDMLGGPYYLQCKNFDRIENIMEEVAEFIQKNIPERLRSELVEK